MKNKKNRFQDPTKDMQDLMVLLEVEVFFFDNILKKHLWANKIFLIKEMISKQPPFRWYLANYERDLKKTFYS